ncbi:uncharacterized protein LOC143279344 [Babylonia areolata]|uniref:uncharacterized protein LOC143279344 n=1 Tax=Babylonia areolata TaxID=304850 RepID=UPI003FD54895
MGGRRPQVMTAPSLLCLFTFLLLCSAVPVPGLQVTEERPQCPEEWLAFAELCWSPVPLGYSLWHDLAATYCQRLHAHLFTAYNVALCFNAGKTEQRRAGQEMTGFRLFQKRVMGNNGM